MNGLYLALIILLILFLIGQIRIGAQVEYCEEGLFVRVRAGAFLFPVFPANAQKEKKKKTKPAKDLQPKKKKGGLLSLALEFIPLVLDTLKKFCRRLRVDRLEMDLTVCAPDPADAAISYGRANALLGSLWQPMTQSFHVKDGHAHVALDFDSDKSTVYIFASVSLTVAQALVLAAVFGWKALGILIRNRTKRNTRTEQGEAV